MAGVSHGRRSRRFRAFHHPGDLDRKFFPEMTDARRFQRRRSLLRAASGLRHSSAALLGRIRRVLGSSQQTRGERVPLKSPCEAAGMPPPDSACQGLSLCAFHTQARH